MPDGLNTCLQRVQTKFQNIESLLGDLESIGTRLGAEPRHNIDDASKNNEKPDPVVALFMAKKIENSMDAMVNDLSSIIARLNAVIN